MSPQSAHSGPPSRWIWPFEILEQIGEGGMGVVYRARYVVNNREVALKMLPGDIQDKTALARFERELEVLKAMRHPHIVRCFGGACEDKRRFYAMELLERGTLENELQRRKKFPWEDVVTYGLQMCAALECSHDHKVIHRDVKPSNFLIAQDGTLKLSDFGLASVVSASRITASGKTAGTFLYMAPEQIRGLEVTARTDLYALGCVLYELVTGDVPFHGETAGATLHLHCTQPPPRPTEKALDCPLPLERIILKLLEKDPAMRYQSAAEVAEELKSLQQESIITHRNEIGKNFPTGYQAALETPSPKRQPSIIQSVQSSSKPTAKYIIDSPGRLAIVGTVIGLSLILNAILLVRASSQNAWRAEVLQASFQNAPEIRQQALLTIGKISQRSSRDLRILQDRLNDSSPDVRQAVVNGLAESGAAGKSVIPKLINLQKNDEDEGVRTAAGFAIQRIQSAEPLKTEFLRFVLPTVILLAALGGIAYGISMYLVAKSK